LNRPKSLARLVRDDVAYILPMAVFLLFTQAGVSWPGLFPTSYIIKTVLTAVLLILLWPHYTKISWRFAWLGALVGIVGVVQWVGMEKGILHFWPNYPRLSAQRFDPFERITAPAVLWIFIAVRLIGPALVVPFMEEFFWRDFLWRTIAAPNDFKMIPVGEWDWRAFAIVTAIFASVHIQWITALVWGSMIALLLVRTRSLGACIVAHGVTNLLLGIYVLHTHDWQFW
jgi:CAAX prenyl protease-like protein